MISVGIQALAASAPECMTSDICIQPQLRALHFKMLLDVKSTVILFFCLFLLSSSVTNVNTASASKVGQN